MLNFVPFFSPQLWGDDLFSELMAGLGVRERTSDFGHAPAPHRARTEVRVYEADPAYTLSADVPGLTEDDLEVQLDDGILTLAGGPPEVSIPDGFEVRHRERSPRRFEYRFELPEGIDLENIGARLNHGVLEVTLPKQAPTAPRTIDVKVG